VTRLQIVEIGKRAGFTLREIRELLNAADEGHPTHERLAALAHAKLAEVDALARRVRAMQRWLRRAGECTCTALDTCELFSPDAISPAGRRRTKA
jgi:DNA-binding transcriptional MerR regulator